MILSAPVPGGSLEVEVADTNHYSIVVGDAGARRVAEQIVYAAHIATDR